jgi:hypothetical protein
MHMVDQWYYARDKERLGPFSSAQLKDLADTGQIRPVDTIWKEGVERGVPAAKVKNLFTQLPASAPAPASEPPPAAQPEPPPSPGPAQGPALSDTDIPAPPADAGSGTVAASTGLSGFVPPVQTDKKGRVLSIKGGILSGQDGIIVRFRKKCETCGYADTSLTTMKIRTGCSRVNFFCRKCRKNRVVEIYGVV